MIRVSVTVPRQALISAHNRIGAQGRVDGSVRVSRADHSFCPAREACGDGSDPALFRRRGRNVSVCRPTGRALVRSRNGGAWNAPGGRAVRAVVLGFCGSGRSASAGLGSPCRFGRLIGGPVPEWLLGCCLPLRSGREGAGLLLLGLGPRRPGLAGCAAQAITGRPRFCQVTLNPSSLPLLKLIGAVRGPGEAAVLYETITPRTFFTS